MSVVATSEGTGGPLEEILRRAGAVFGAHEGRLVALNYGSAAGELAACVHAVGLADVSAGSKLELTGGAAQLDAELARLLGRPLAAREAVRANDAWWCLAEPGRAVVLAEPQLGHRLYESLHDRILRRAGITVRDRSDEWAMIELIGRRAPRVLAVLGVLESASPTPCLVGVPLQGATAHWLLASEHVALALVDRGDALATWHAIEAAGAPFGLTYVGQEAAARYQLLEGAHRAP